MIVDGPFDVVLGSRILGGRALAGGMPLYKYVANRILTAVQNLLCGREALRVPHRLPRLLARGARVAAAARELRRLRLRQPDARADPARRLRDRRDLAARRRTSRRPRRSTSALGALRTRLPADGCAAVRAATRLASFPIFADGGRRLAIEAPAEKRVGGPGRNRTGINGFAVRWLSHSPTGPRRDGDHSSRAIRGYRATRALDPRVPRRRSSVRCSASSSAASCSRASVPRFRGARSR